VLAVVGHYVVGGNEGGHVAACLFGQIVVDFPIIGFPSRAADGFVKIDGATAYTTGVKLDVNNNISQLNVLGQNAAYGTYLGMKTVSGSLTLVYEDNTFYNKFINNTSASLQFQLSDGTNSHTYMLPNIKLSKVAAATNEGVRLLTCDFVGLYDATLASIMSITRTGV
jgi:hypothetical protein